MKQIKIGQKNRRRGTKKIFGKYFLLFSNNEFFLLFNFLLLLIFPSYALIENGFKYSNVLCLLPFSLLAFIIYRRFFKEIKTNLNFDENVTIIKDIGTKQKRVYTSKNNRAVYIFEIQHSGDNEYIVIICDKNAIFVNNFYDRRLYQLFNNKSLKSLRDLIVLKVNTFNTKRVTS